MTGIIWACAATFIAACVPILPRLELKTDPALVGSIAGIVLCASIFFYRKDNIMGSSLIALTKGALYLYFWQGLQQGFLASVFLNPYMRATHFRLQL